MNAWRFKSATKMSVVVIDWFWNRTFLNESQELKEQLITNGIHQRLYIFQLKARTVGAKNDEGMCDIKFTLKLYVITLQNVITRNTKRTIEEKG